MDVLTGLAVALLLAAEPGPQALVYFNARVALREERPTEVLKLWLLRNALESQGHLPEWDPDFRSLVWGALGDTGYCPDGLRDDEGGAGIWPLAVHNLLVRSFNRTPPGDSVNPFEAFEVGQQRRYVALDDVLSAHELDAVSFRRTGCSTPGLFGVGAGENPFWDKTDRLATARVLRKALLLARKTVNGDRVRNREVLDARIFDVELLIIELQERRQRQEARRERGKAKGKGLTPAELRMLRAEDGLTAEMKRVLAGCFDWPTNVWMALEARRRRFIFERALKRIGSSAASDQAALAVIDRLVESEEGGEVERWIAFLRPEASPHAGSRGVALLALDDESGFRERGPVALRRGIDFLNRGELQKSLDSLALAAHFAPQSREPEPVRGLALRWLSYTLSKFGTDPVVLERLAALVPREAYRVVVEDLVWAAALRRDAASFEVASEGLRAGSGLARRVDRLRPLVADRFIPSVVASMEDEPQATIRFLTRYVERLEAEDADVRVGHEKILSNLDRYLKTVEDGRAARRVLELRRRIGAVLEGVLALRGASSRGTPFSDTFVGAVRVAPTDEVPWPFAVGETRAPSAFEPIQLIPVEWSNDRHRRVFGWSFAG